MRFGQSKTRLEWLDRLLDSTSLPLRIDPGHLLTFRVVHAVKRRRHGLQRSQILPCLGQRLLLMRTDIGYTRGVDQPIIRVVHESGGAPQFLLSCQVSVLVRLLSRLKSCVWGPAED